ncbi:MAG: hypothetical protein QHJ82_11970 [Verrucomicrobiota bacterium]|nr:hypothetical protein [Verrucomicrobiota bacterium]
MKKSKFSLVRCVGTRRAFLISTALIAAASFAGLLFAQSDVALDHRNPRVQQVMALQDAVTPELMKLDDIIGTATGLDDQGNVAVVVYINQLGRSAAAIARAMPKDIRGTPVVVEFTDEIRALKPGPAAKPAPTPTVDHKAKQTPPIQLGTSGGWTYDLANGYCCGGTLGSLVQVNGTKYILSNYHVFEADIVDGGNNRQSADGDPIIQPGLIDVGCNADNAQPVATLVKLSSLPESNVDASVAAIIPGMVRDDGAILEIGTISSSTVSASLNQKVKKSGRTTGLTRSYVRGVNATVTVAYDNECAGGDAFTKTFTGQIIVANRLSKFKFLAGGDSGSLMVEDVTTNPRAVGLLFAGSSTLAVANPIGEVLTFIGKELGGTATMVGN